jgi:hypothetical protein
MNIASSRVEVVPFIQSPDKVITGKNVTMKIQKLAGKVCIQITKVGN